jgi:hypothetical protein
MFRRLRLEEAGTQSWTNKSLPKQRDTGPSHKAGNSDAMILSIGETTTLLDPNCASDHINFATRATGMDHLSPDPDDAPMPHNSVFLKIAGFDDCERTQP